MKKTATRLSICMIVKNEAENLPDLLASIEPLGAELIVVDTGSTDATREIAQAAGAKVVRWTWTHDFAAARNVSLTHATRPWILWLDGDDRLPPESVEPLLRLTEAPPDRAWAFVVRNTGGAGTNHGAFFSQLRLFPNHPRLRFTGAVHEQIYPALAQLGLPWDQSPVRLLHTGYADPDTVRAKQRRNREILRREVESGDAGAIQFYQLGSAEVAVEEWAAGEQAFRRCLELVRQGDADQHLKSLVPSSLARAIIPQRGPAEAWKVLQQEVDPDPASWHPSQTALWAKLCSAFQGPDQGLEFWEKAFEPEEGKALLPIDTRAVCHESLEAIAGYWRDHGRTPLGVAVLRMLKALLEGKSLRRHDLPQAYLTHGEANRAAELFAWCLEKNPDDAVAWAGLVRCLRAAGDPGAADQFLSEARRRLPAAPELIGV